jgi:uncharacterized protein (DUF433 family)
VSQRAWNSAQEAEILEMWAVGHPPRDIYAAFGYRRNAFYALLERAGARPSGRSGPWKRLDQVDVDEIVKRWRDGWSLAEIGHAGGGRYGKILARRVLEEAGERVRPRPTRAVRRGPDAPHWTGGRVSVSAGYVGVLIPDDHPFASMRNGRYVLEHRLVVAEFLGRPLRTTETVHHKNGDRRDNRLGNLQLRHGQHGAGQALRCASCGSTDLEALDI